VGELEQIGYDASYGSCSIPRWSAMESEDCDPACSAGPPIWPPPRCRFTTVDPTQLPDPLPCCTSLYWLASTSSPSVRFSRAWTDAHWADSASIAFSGYLARPRRVALALLIFYSTRIGEGSSDALPPRRS